MVARRNISSIVNLTAAAFVAVSTHVPAALAQGQAPSPDCLRLGADQSLAQFYALFENAIAQVYADAGFCAVSVPLSPKRIENLMASGGLDGDWIRVEGYPELFEIDLIALKPALFQMEAKLVTTDRSDFDGTVADLKGRRVGYQAGFRWLEKNLPATGAIVIEMPSGVPIKDLLARGRFDVFATDGVRAEQIKETYEGTGDQPIIYAWRSIPFHHMLHKKHRGKATAISQALAKGIQSGLFNGVYELPGLSPPPAFYTKPD